MKGIPFNISRAAFLWSGTSGESHISAQLVKAVTKEMTSDEVQGSGDNIVLQHLIHNRH